MKVGDQWGMPPLATSLGSARAGVSPPSIPGQVVPPVAQAHDLLSLHGVHLAVLGTYIQTVRRQ